MLSNNGADLVDFADILIGEIILKEGLNTIKLKTLFDNPEVNTTLASIIFANTDAKLDYSSSAISMNKFIFEAEEAELVQVNGNPHVSSGWDSSNNNFLGGVNDCAVFCPGQAKIILRITSSSEMFAKFYVNAGTAVSCNANKAFIATLNGESITSDQHWSQTGWYGWTNFYYGTLKLNAGENVLELTLGSEATMNIDYFLFESLGTITK